MLARRRPTGKVAEDVSPRALRRAVLMVFGGLWILCLLSAVALAQRSSAVAPARRSHNENHIAEAAKRFRLPPTWIRAVLVAESAGDQRATSRKGAMGLMQIVPKTWSELRSRYQLGGDPYDPHDNILAGSAYIRELDDRYGSPGWIAAYNAGPGRYEEWLQGRQLPRETRDYLAIVASAINKDGAAKFPRTGGSPRHGWKYASLFAAQSHGSARDRPAHLKRARDDASRAMNAQELSPIAPRSANLFVPTASEISTR